MFNRKYLIILLLTCLSAQAEQPLDDPTQPKFHSSNVEQKIAISNPIKLQHLTAIFMKKYAKNAIINNSLYKEGDYVGNNKIISIESNRVTLKNAKGISRLYLTKSIKKQPKLK